MIPAVARARNHASSPVNRHKTGGCNGGCNCDACPTGQGPFTVNQVAELLGRNVAGLTGRCKYNFIHMTNANRGAGVAALAVETITENVQIGLCIQQVVVVPREVAIPGTIGTFTLANLTLANKPQWLLNRVYHSRLFGFNSECSCCLPGDCTTIGTLAAVTVTNIGALAANIDVYLIGPSVG